HQSTDHHEHPQHKPAGGRGPGLCPELPGSQSCRRGPHHDADDLRPDVLHIGGAVEPQGAGDVPQEAGDAEAHVLGVAGGGKDQGGNAHGHARRQDQSVFPKPTLFSHKYTPHSLRRWDEN
ncbi:HTH cro/C1-type domain-containing protein, partial [Dysosmobacter welbionis]